LCIRGVGSFVYWIQEIIRSKTEVNQEMMKIPYNTQINKPSFVGALRDQAVELNAKEKSVDITEVRISNPQLPGQIAEFRKLQNEVSLDLPKRSEDIKADFRDTDIKSEMKLKAVDKTNL
jgi:hypothetical protein